MHTPHLPHTSLRSIIWFLLAMLLFSVMNNSARQAMHYMHSTELVLWRNAFITLLMGTWILLMRKPSYFRTANFGRHLWQKGMGVLAVELWFYALAHLPLNEATALSFTSPIFVSLFAILFLKERSNISRWLAIALGFGGMLLILHPNDLLRDPAALAVLGSSALLAGGSIIMKMLTRTEWPETIIFYQGAIMLPLSLPFALPHLAMPSGEALQWALVVSALSIAANLCMIYAFFGSEVAALMPFDYTRLLFTATVSYLWYHETLSRDTLLGAALIVAASVWSVLAANDTVRRSFRRIRMMGRQ